MADRTVDDLIGIAEGIPESLRLAEGMAGIRGRAQDAGVTLAVDLHGQLVELDLAKEALDLGPQQLAAAISRLVAQASTDALRGGMRAITAGAPGVAAAISEHLGITGEEEDSAAPQPAVAAEPVAVEPVRPQRTPAPKEDEAEGASFLEDAWG